MTLNHAITRRSALKGIAAWIGTARFAYAAEPSTAGRFVEKQPTGAEIWQVTTDGRYYAGATLYVLSVPEGRRTELAVGTPHTTPCTGHEAWIGTTGEMLLSVSASGEFRPEKRNLRAIRPERPPRVVARGYRFNHVRASRWGRIFSADAWQPPYKIVIGSTQAERAAVICESKTAPTRSQNTHPHPNVTPDLKWVIFNSNRTGSDHIYAARIPDERMASLLG